MPNERRTDPDEVPQHIIFRGTERKKIFRCDEDRAHMVDLLRRAVTRHGVTFFAWSLMPNHGHLVLKRGRRTSLGRVMQSIESPYASYFNKKYGRVGPLVQGRYLSLVVRELVYFKRVVPYTLANPLTAGIVRSVSELRRFPWTSLREFCRGKGGFTDDEELVRVFGNGDRSAAQRELEARVRVAADDADALDRDIVRGDIADDIPITLVVRPTVMSEELTEFGLTERATFDQLSARVCQAREVKPSILKAAHGSRAASRVRDEIAALAAAKLGISVSEIAREMNVTPGAITRAIRRASNR